MLVGGHAKYRDEGSCLPFISRGIYKLGTVLRGVYRVDDEETSTEFTSGVCRRPTSFLFQYLKAGGMLPGPVLRA